VTISTRLSWTPAQVNLSDQARKALTIVDRVNYNLDYPFSSGCKIFDTCVLPILTYCSEVWGNDVHKVIEDVHVKFCRNQLGVGKRASSAAVRGECGRHKIEAICIMKCIKYWIKILQMPEGCLVKACYNMLVTKSNSGGTNWASKVKDILYRHGYGYVWEAQGLIEMDTFLNQFYQTMLDSEMQLWSNEVAQQSRLSTYIKFKCLFETEVYLSLDLPMWIRRKLSRFRISNHDLEIELGRHNQIPREKRLCKICKDRHLDVIESEIHFVLECEAYAQLRLKYIDERFCGQPLESNFINLFNSKNEEKISNLAFFLHAAFNVREVLLKEKTL